MVLSGSGSIIALTDYYPFGTLRINEKIGSFEEKKKFTGHELDPETGLTYAGARYYSAEVGRFISQDTVAKDTPGKVLMDPQLLNAYSYTRNNPLKYTDPDGTSPILILGIAAAILFADIEPTYAPSSENYQFTAGSKTFGELAVAGFDGLPGYQKEAIRWTPAVAGGMRSIGRNGVQHFATNIEKRIVPQIIKRTDRAVSVSAKIGNDVVTGPVYRGGGDFKLRERDFSVDTSTGLIDVERTTGISTHMNPNNQWVKSFGKKNGIYTIESLPKGLKFKPILDDPQHFGIVPSYSMTPGVYQSLLEQVKMSPY